MTMDIEETYQLGFQMRCDGRYAEAKQQFERVLRAKPNHVDSLHQMALIAGFEGDFDGSLASLTKLSAGAPGNLNIRYDLAMTQMMLGMYEEACGNLRHILSVDPNHEKANQQATYC